MKRARTNQKGTAVILALILIAVLSVMAVSMMFLSQSEGWSSANYRLMSQARDGAEAGLNAGVAYIQNTYVPPTDATGDSDQISAYTVSSTAVQGTNVLFNGSPVVLSADPNVTSNYNSGAAAKQTAFNTAYSGGKGTLAAGTTKVNYYSSAKLLSQTLIQPDAGATPSLDTSVQTWEITGRGTVAGVQGAEVQVSAILDRNFSYTPGTTIPGTPGTTTYTPIFNYAAFGVGDQCSPPQAYNSLDLQGNVATSSYDSHSTSETPSVACDFTKTLSATNCANSGTSGGNVGTNGYLGFTGNAADVGGSLSTPRTGVGSCSSGGGTNNAGLLDQGETHLPAEVSYPSPAFPSGVPLTTQTLPNTKICPASITSGCSPFDQATCPGCSGAPAAATNGEFLLQPGSYGNVSGKDIYLVGGTYNFNTLGSNFYVIPGTGPVTVNLTGCAGSSGTASCGGYATAATSGDTNTSHYLTTFPLSGTIYNLSGDATQLTIMYGGPTTFNDDGNGQNGAAALYIPNAIWKNGGTMDLYGAIIAKEVYIHGNVGIHYDRHLGTCNGASSDCNTITTAGTPATTTNPTTIPGNFTLRQFTWKKF